MCEVTAHQLFDETGTDLPARSVPFQVPLAHLQRSPSACRPPAAPPPCPRSGPHHHHLDTSERCRTLPAHYLTGPPTKAQSPGVSHRSRGAEVRRKGHVAHSDPLASGRAGILSRAVQLQRAHHHHSCEPWARHQEGRERAQWLGKGARKPALEMGFEGCIRIYHEWEGTGVGGVGRCCREGTGVAGAVGQVSREGEERAE